jgi:hypothetical protein
MEGQHTNVVEGCVRNFQRVIHTDDHDLADTAFAINDVNFHFNSSPFLPGFHNEPNVIRPGDRLKITRVRNVVLRIERQTPLDAKEGPANHP